MSLERNPDFAGLDFEEIRERINRRNTTAPCCFNCRWWDTEDNEKDYGCRACLNSKTQFRVGKPWLYPKGYEICDFYQEKE